MEWFKSIGNAFKSIGQSLGKVSKGVAKFAESPFGKLLVNVGLSFVTGGAGGLLSKGLGMLSKLGGAKLTGVFSGFATKFLGGAQGFLSKSGLGGIAQFLKGAGSTRELLSMAKDIFLSRQRAPQMDGSTRQIIQHNLLQLFAKRQAQLFGQ
jgi:hypothetical protein